MGGVAVAEWGTAVAAFTPLITFSLILLSHIAIRLISGFLQKQELQPAERELMEEIKNILRQASTLSTPSTFAKAAKLRRTAVAKEKELARLRQNLAGSQGWAKWFPALLPTLLKAVFYLFLWCWFWSSTIASVPSLLLKPFDKALSWESKDGHSEKFVLIGILPWLIVCTRVSAFVSGKVIK